MSGSDSDSDDGWYDRMEAECMKQELVPDAESSSVEVNKLPPHDDYFEAVLHENCERIGSGFAPESDIVWQSVLKSVAGSSTGTKIDGMYELTKKDDAAIMSLQGWLASYLPRSSKVLMELSLFISSTDSGKTLFTDDPLYPSVVFLVKIFLVRVEVVMFTPYSKNEVPIVPMLRCIERVQRPSGLKDLLLCGLDGAFYECGILKQVAPQWTPMWVEACGHYTNDSALSALHNADKASLADEYALCDLSQDDAEIINSNWTYKSATSLALVRTMIDKQLCAGVRSVADGALVTWFLTYPDGSIGMLFTHPNHRGKGLARAVAKRVLEKTAAAHAVEPRLCAPFLYIERSNDASRALFTSLGFVKCNDVVWAGLELNDA